METPTSNTFYHRGSKGDIIYSLPTIRAMGGGNLVLKKPEDVSFLRLLLESQPYISLVEPLLHFNYNTYLINLDSFRPVHRNDPCKHLVHCFLEANQQEIPSQIDSWINDIEPNYVADIVINRTPRYHDGRFVNWKFLKEYEGQSVFVGLIDEYRKFCSISEVIPEFIPVKTALELAQIIRGSKVFIGNQSCAYAIAEAMQHNRILETYAPKANCYPLSSNGYMTENMEEIIPKLVSCIS